MSDPRGSNYSHYYQHPSQRGQPSSTSHQNVKLSPASAPPPSSSSSNVHINPKFPNQKSNQVSSEKVLVNPKFQACAPASPPRMHINPKFANRPLPVAPPVKPVRTSLARAQSFAGPPSRSEPVYARLTQPPLINQTEKARFEASIKQSLESKVLINPKFAAPIRTRTAPAKPARHSMFVTNELSRQLDAGLVETPKTDKENLPAVKGKMNLFTPLRKSAAFRKIGSRKLVRKKSGSEAATPPASFKKIGTKKLIRINDSAKRSEQQYEVKTKSKLVKTVKNTPSNMAKYRFSFITPLSIRKTRRTPRSSASLKKSSRSTTKARLSSFRSRFKLDRRSGKGGKAEPKILFQQPASSSAKPRVKKLSGAVYRVSATRLSKLPTGQQGRIRHAPAPPHPSLATSRIIIVQGVKWEVTEQGRKLRRLPVPTPALSYSASVSQTSPGQGSSSPTTGPSPARPAPSPVPSTGSHASAPAKKVYLGGEEFDEVEPGVFNRSRHSLTRQSITQAKNRSINTIMKNANRSKQYCMFYNKFGKCTKKEAGSCPFIHDKEKIAVCRRFLQGSCHKENCLLSHRAAPEKMPVCKYFLEGVCSKENCSYLHVKVSATAEICPAFLRGYCSNGSDCRLRHVMACPEFDKTGTCSRSGAARPSGRCPFPHISTQPLPAPPPPAESLKRVPPSKPKRKSLGHITTDLSIKKSRVQARYFEEDKDEKAMGGTGVKDDSEEMEEKRLRLLGRLELAKQGWAGVSVSVASRETQDQQQESQGSGTGLDDSGPYERIDSDSSEEESGRRAGQRRPIGQLGDFISLAGYSSEEEEACTDRRLI